MNILESARTVYFVFSKAALINVVAEMENNCAWPEWTADTAAVKDMETFTLEALVYANSFDRKISTIMGIEDLWLINLIMSKEFYITSLDNNMNRGTFQGVFAIFL